MIEVTNLTKKYDKKMVFSNVSFKIEKGAFTTIYGPSGYGKTTLINILGMIESFDSGSVIIDGVKVPNRAKANKAVQKLRREKVSYLFQNFGLLEDRTIYENLNIPFEFEKINPKNLKKNMINVLKVLGIDKDLNTKIYTLSGGEQQRVAIAKVLLEKPKIIFADEPTGSLDEDTANNIIKLLLQISRKLNITIVMVTHDLKIKNISSQVIDLAKLKG